jgi:hypothetical protein
VIEHWNSANDVIFYGKDSELMKIVRTALPSSSSAW